MRRRKSPQLKKQDEYDKDYRPYTEYPHAFRKNWPKKKARANRRERSLVKILFQSTTDESKLTRAAIRSVKKRLPKIVKNGVVTLRERIENNHKKRGLKPGIPSRI